MDNSPRRSPTRARTGSISASFKKPPADMFDSAGLRNRMQHYAKVAAAEKGSVKRGDGSKYGISQVGAVCMLLELSV